MSLPTRTTCHRCPAFSPPETPAAVNRWWSGRFPKAAKPLAPSTFISWARPSSPDRRQLPRLESLLLDEIGLPLALDQFLNRRRCRVQRRCGFQIGKEVAPVHGQVQLAAAMERVILTAFHDQECRR